MEKKFEDYMFYKKFNKNVERYSVRNIRYF